MIRSVVVSMLPLLTRSPTEAAKGIYRNLAKRCQLNWKDRGCQWYTPSVYRLTACRAFVPLRMARRIRDWRQPARTVCRNSRVFQRPPESLDAANWISHPPRQGDSCSFLTPRLGLGVGYPSSTGGGEGLARNRAEVYRYGSLWLQSRRHHALLGPTY
jgi:hypothetical protein